jgi:hypothetical protein
VRGVRDHRVVVGANGLDDLIRNEVFRPSMEGAHAIPVRQLRQAQRLAHRRQGRVSGEAEDSDEARDPRRPRTHDVSIYLE